MGFISHGKNSLGNYLVRENVQTVSSGEFFMGLLFSKRKCVVGNVGKKLSLNIFK